MTIPDKIAEWKRVCAEAPPGPYQYSQSVDGRRCSLRTSNGRHLISLGPDDLEVGLSADRRSLLRFIQEARTALPELLQEREELMAENSELGRENVRFGQSRGSLVRERDELREALSFAMDLLDLYDRRLATIDGDEAVYTIDHLAAKKKARAALEGKGKT